LSFLREPTLLKENTQTQLRRQGHVPDGIHTFGGDLAYNVTADHLP
jgi:hypothetical protein